MNTETMIYLVDDDTDVLDSLKWLIESAGWRVSTFASSQELLDELSGDHAELSGCIIADVRLPGMSGLGLQQELIKRGVRLPVIIITGHGDVSMAVRAIKAGAIDFIEKPFPDQILLDRIGEAVIADDQRRKNEIQFINARHHYEKLSAREKQVMGEVVDGKPNKQIATTLGVCQKTVEVHRSHVMEKMQAKSLAQLVRIAVAIESSEKAAGLEYRAGSTASPL